MVDALNLMLVKVNDACINDYSLPDSVASVASDSMETTAAAAAPACFSALAFFTAGWVDFCSLQ